MKSVRILALLTCIAIAPLNAYKLNKFHKGIYITTAAVAGMTVFSACRNFYLLVRSGIEMEKYRELNRTGKLGGYSIDYVHPTMRQSVLYSVNASSWATAQHLGLYATGLFGSISLATHLVSSLFDKSE